VGAGAPTAHGRGVPELTAYSLPGYGS
jgi:hypothetical protein